MVLTSLVSNQERFWQKSICFCKLQGVLGFFCYEEIIVISCLVLVLAIVWLSDVSMETIYCIISYGMPCLS